MSSLRLALKQSLQETGHLIKDKKKKGGRRGNKSSGGRRSSLSRDSSDQPRKRGRPRKHPAPDGNGGTEDGEDGSSQRLDETEDHSHSEEESESENEFSYNSEEEEDDSEEDREEGEEVDQDEKPLGEMPCGDNTNKNPVTEIEKGHFRYQEEKPVASPSPSDGEIKVDSEEERRRQKKLFKKHLQQAANKIQAQWKKKANFTPVVERNEKGENDGSNVALEDNGSSGDNSHMRNNDTPIDNSNTSSTPNNSFKEKKKKERTVPAPDVEVLEWSRGLPEKKCQKHVSTGLRVKVRFAAKVKREGKVVKKKIWYGGRVSAVSKDGSKIRIKYDDSTSEISKFPDKDVVVDDKLNGQHRVPADKFIPPSMRESSNEDLLDQNVQTESLSDDHDVDGKSHLTGEDKSTNALLDVAETPVLKSVDPNPNDGEIVVSSERVQEDIIEKTEGKENEKISFERDEANASDCLSVEEGELADEQERKEHRGLPHSLSEKSVEKPKLNESTKACEITNVNIEGKLSQETLSKSLEKQVEDKTFHTPITTADLTHTPKKSLTIRIQNVKPDVGCTHLVKRNESPNSESEEELFADTPITERKVKSIQLKGKKKRKREGDTSHVDEEPTKKKNDIRDCTSQVDPETPKAIDDVKKPDVEMSALIDTPILSANANVEAPSVDMPAEESPQLPMLPRLETQTEKVASSINDATALPLIPSSPAVVTAMDDGNTQTKSELKPLPEPKAVVETIVKTDEDIVASETKQVAPISRTKGSSSSLSGNRNERKTTQSEKEKTASKQEERHEKKKKRKRKDGETDPEQTDDLSVDDRQWVQCDSCAKWRILPSHVKESSLPKHWYCHLNTFDPKRNNCTAPEQTAKQAAKEWRKARKRAKQQRLAQLQVAEIEVPTEVSSLEAIPSVGPKSPKVGKSTKKIKRALPVLAEEAVSGSDVPKIEKKGKRGRPPAQEAQEPPLSPVPEVDAPKKPGRKRGRPARNQTPQKENEDGDNVEWVQCEKCEKWRKLPPHISADELPDKWYCNMNTWNRDSASCTAPEDKADASHHEVGTFAGMFGTGAGKNSYRALIFGTGKKHNRPMSERSRAAESLFMRPIDEIENPHPTVMYSKSSCFLPRTSNFIKASAVDDEKSPTLFEILSNSEVFAELHNRSLSFQGNSSNVSAFEDLSDDVRHAMREMVLETLSGCTLTGDEIILTVVSFPWESLAAEFVGIRKYFDANLIVHSLLSLVKDGIVEMSNYRNAKLPIGQWIPRYRKVRSSRAIQIEEAIKNSRCMKIAKPWKRTNAQPQDWVSGEKAFP